MNIKGAAVFQALMLVLTAFATIGMSVEPKLPADR